MNPRLDAWLRVLSALAGTLPVAVLTSVCLARFLPLSEDARFAWGYTALIPLWITAMCIAFLSRSGALALAVCVGVSGLLSILVYGVPR
jgi:hypothetical protein